MRICAYTTALASHGPQRLLKDAVMSMRAEWRVSSVPDRERISRQPRPPAVFMFSVVMVEQALFTATSGLCTSMAMQRLVSRFGAVPVHSPPSLARFPPANCSVLILLRLGFHMYMCCDSPLPFPLAPCHPSADFDVSLDVLHEESSQQETLRLCCPVPGRRFLCHTKGSMHLS